MNDPFGRPIAISESKKKNQDVVKRLESLLYLIRVSEDDVADLSECELTSLPSEFYNLCRIFRKEVVNISGNRLNSLKIKGSETDLLKLNGILKRLNASSNLLKEFPSGLLTVHSLIKLDLSRNQIAQVPKGISELCQLQELYLRENVINEIPSSISRLVVLRILDISLNKIRSLPASLAFLKQLEVLRIDEDKMENPPAEVCSHGLQAIQIFLKQALPSGKDILEKNNIILNGLPVSTVNSEKVNAVDISCADVVGKKKCFLQMEKEKDELSDLRLKKLIADQKELDDLIQNAFNKHSDDLKSIAEDLSELEKHTSSLIETFLKSFTPVGVKEDSESLQVEEVLRKRRAEFEQEQKEWLRSVDEESDSLARVVYFEADQRRKRSMDEVAKKINEVNLLVNLKTEEAQNNFAKICKEIAADQSLLEDFVLSVRERADVNSHNLSLEAETIAKALADISLLEMRKKDDQNSLIAAKLKEERGRLLMLYEQISAERDFRRKQLYMDMQAELEKEEKAQKKIVAECLKRYAELMTPVQRNLAPVPQKSKLSRRLGPFNILFGWKKKSEKTGKKGLRDKLEDVATESPIVSEFHILPKHGDAKSHSMVVARYEEECVVCFSDTVKVLISPCGHVCLCENCASTIHNCPLCRSEIVRKILLSSAW